MKDKDLIGSKGRKIIQIDFGDENIKTLSQLTENWEIPSKCPVCNRNIIFNKQSVNKLITCKCGQKLQLQIPEHLL